MSIFSADSDDFDLISIILFIFILILTPSTAYNSGHKYHKFSTLHKANRVFGLKFRVLSLLVIV